MPEYTCPPVAPAGYRLVPDEHFATITTALHRRIIDLEWLFQTCPQSAHDASLINDHEALAKALRVIDPELAAVRDL